MSEVISSSQIDVIVGGIKPSAFSYSNVDYRSEKDMLVISEKFYANLFSMSAIPSFSV